MEYKQIYYERIVNPQDPMVRADQFYALTVFYADYYLAPMLLMVEWGNPQLDDWERSWEILDTRIKSEAIRAAIKRIDNFRFK